MRRGALPGSTRGVSLYDPSNPRASMDHRPESSFGGNTHIASGSGSHNGSHQADESVASFSNDDHRRR